MYTGPNTQTNFFSREDNTSALESSSILSPKAKMIKKNQIDFTSSAYSSTQQTPAKLHVIKENGGKKKDNYLPGIYNR